MEAEETPDQVNKTSRNSEQTEVSSEAVNWGDEPAGAGGEKGRGGTKEGAGGRLRRRHVNQQWELKRGRKSVQNLSFLRELVRTRPAWL
ncbi:UNVERIFIED_CONTAM: hypothetical protein Sradi_6418500 [Sesamum radiatum]|uniref:Uncharacterized protein n=1 Tax=Sesamum radiatum TaxID=300843 RepID=A0AAW2K5E7_SESRA